MDQLSFSGAEHHTKRKRPRREIFLDETDRAVPWAQLESLIQPFYPKAGNGRAELVVAVDIGASIEILQGFVIPWAEDGEYAFCSYSF